MPETRETFKFEVVGATGTGVKDRWEAPFSGEIVGVIGVLGTAGTATTTIADIQKNGTSVYTGTSPDNRPTFAISATQLSTPPAWAPSTSYVVNQRVTVSAVQGAGTSPGVYKCLVAHTSPATFDPLQWASAAAIATAGGNPRWVELPAGPNSPDVTTFVAGDIFTLNMIQSGTSAADLDLIVEYVAE